MSNKTQESNQKIKELILNVLSLLGIQEDLVEVTETSEEINVLLNLKEEEGGIYIGHQGDTLNSIQLILSLMVSNRLEDWKRIKLDIGDYRQRRMDVLLQKADQAAQRAILTKMEIILPNLNSYERRLVHSHLTQRGDVLTESRGNPPFRHLYVIPKLQ